MTGTEETRHDDGASSPDASPALFRVVKGNPDAEQIAALTAVLAALSGVTPGTDEPAADGPGARREALRSQFRRRRQLSGHPGAWRSGRF
ncbi:acyl-CoA carboxylase epsilon subunit [Arthrobacter sp.]|uniref:acyl-CoA carboxylase epsilon subunit n=1 Tax=Arthrobacter sp. TaxID=1667 RepID=UPI003A94AB27